MAFLILGLVLFFVPHLIKATPLRTSLSSQLSENQYKGLVSLVMLVGFVLIIYGKARAPFVHIWSGFVPLRHLTMLLVLFAFLFLSCSGKTSNLKRVTRHPMLWGVVFWATGHLLVNGDLASILLFGSFLVYSVFAMVMQNRRGLEKTNEAVPWKFDIVQVIGAVVVYLVVFYFHGFLFGVALR